MVRSAGRPTCRGCRPAPATGQARGTDGGTGKARSSKPGHAGRRVQGARPDSGYVHAVDDQWHRAGTSARPGAGLGCGFSSLVLGGVDDVFAALGVLLVRGGGDGFTLCGLSVRHDEIPHFQ
uniref:hypothetical protein n=1 Tax=Streptomyces sp. FR1 TaxID=349971 RepID=UPI0015E84F66|nr:hypothetical protein [Streptomyces sp. FR1]